MACQVSDYCSLAMLERFCDQIVSRASFALADDGVGGQLLQVMLQEDDSFGSASLNGAFIFQCVPQTGR